MKNTTDFIFDRKLEPEELNFWSTFFDHFPYHHNRYIQSFVSSFAKEINNRSDIENYYEQVNSLTSKEELLNLIKVSNFSNIVKENYPNVINDIDKVFPNSKPIELFLMSLYSGYIQNMNLEVTAYGINLLLGDRPIEQITYTPELAFICDFMSERANQIFPNLNFKPIHISGEKVLVDSKNNKSFMIKVEDGSRVTRMSKKDNSFIHDFSFDFSKNSSPLHDLFSPLQQEQEKFIKIIQKHYLENSLENKENRYNTKRKI